MIKKNQHEEYKRFINKPTRESLRTLIEFNTGEADYLEFKSNWQSFPNIAKLVLAFANSGGGVLIVGIEERVDNTYKSIGIDKLLDKDEISKGIQKFIPVEVEFNFLDFNFENSEYHDIKGKIFQVIIVEYNEKILPILSLKEGDGIKANVVYLRRGTSTTEANHIELQKIINKRIETGYSSTHVLELLDHLEQLKTLYQSIYVSPIDELFSFGINTLNGDSTTGFKNFVFESIKLKEKRIKLELDINRLI